MDVRDGGNGRVPPFIADYNVTLINGNDKKSGSYAGNPKTAS